MRGGPARFAHRTRVNHAAVVQAARAVPGQWVRAGVYASLHSADAAARRIPGAERMPAYRPAGSFEAYAVTTVEGPILWVRSTEGGPHPVPPARMSVRVPVAGPDAGVLTVSVIPYCRTCGGLRGWDRVEPVTLDLQGTAVVVDRWSNSCGHEDAYADVLTEARRTPPHVNPATARGRGHHTGSPARAGRFQTAVELILQAAAESRGMQGRQVAALLRLNGHERAAALVEARARAARGHFSAAQAAHFLTVEGAARRSSRTVRQEAHA